MLASLSLTASAQVSVSIDAGQPGARVPDDLYGIFFEDINHAADGGLYAELIGNRSFEDDAVATPRWSVTADAGASVAPRLVTKDLLNDAQHQALQLTVSARPEAQAALVNEGFWGIHAVQGRSYRLSLWIKGHYKGTLRAQLTDSTGRKVYAETLLEGRVGKTWAKKSALLTACGTDPKARFRLVADGKGTLTLDVVSLFPPTFRDRDNGCRADLAQMLYELHPRFMRFPGGCFVEGQDSPDNAFRWERTVGPVETRPGHHNVNWRYRTSDGMGFHEYLQLAEDLHAKPLYVVNVGIWHGGMTPVDSLQPWIDECMHALEYANGPVTTKYGALRARNGHPAPFGIAYVEIGNENNQPDPTQQSDHYYERYRMFRDAILAVYPDMQIIGNVTAWGTDEPRWTSSEAVDLVDEHYYRTPAWFADNFHKYDKYDRRGPKVYVGEYAVTQGFGHMGSLDAALGEAVYMMGIERNADVVSMASYAPIFANLNDRMWAPDMIQFTSDRVFGTPSYYVQRMMARHIGTRVLPLTLHNPYPLDGEVAKVKPAVCRVGMGTWKTQATFDDRGYTDAEGHDLPMTLQIDPLDVSGAWTEASGYVRQTSSDESCIRLNPGRITSDGYVYKVRARKDAGAEGFLIVFNYVDEHNYCWLNLGGWGNTQHGIEQIVGGNSQQTAACPGHIDTGRWYDVTLRVKGDSVFASLDGTQILATRLKANTTSDVYASATLDEPSGDVIVKMVNTSATATTAHLSLCGRTVKEGSLTRLASPCGTDENTIDEPTRVHPTTTFISTRPDGAEMELPAHSLTILRLRTGE